MALSNGISKYMEILSFPLKIIAPLRYLALVEV